MQFKRATGIVATARNHLLYHRGNLLQLSLGRVNCVVKFAGVGVILCVIRRFDLQRRLRPVEFTSKPDFGVKKWG